MLHILTATQQSQVRGKGGNSNTVETRSKKHPRSEIFETRSNVAKKIARIGRTTTTLARGGMSSTKTSQRMTRSVVAQAVEQASTLPVAASQPVPALRARQAAEFPPPRVRSQRILQKRLSAPITGPGSSKDNEIVLH